MQTDAVRVQRPTPFYGQMGSIYIFDDAITAAQVKAIHLFGASYMASFQLIDKIETQELNAKVRFPAPSLLFGWRVFESHIRSHFRLPLLQAQEKVLDGSLSSKIFVQYNCKASSG